MNTLFERATDTVQYDLFSGIEHIYVSDWVAINDNMNNFDYEFKSDDNPHEIKWLKFSITNIMHEGLYIDAIWNSSKNPWTDAPYEYHHWFWVKPARIKMEPETMEYYKKALDFLMDQLANNTYLNMPTDMQKDIAQKIIGSYH